MLANLQNSCRGRLAADGFVLVPQCLSSHDVAAAIDGIDKRALASKESTIHRRGEMFAARNLLQVVPELRSIFELPRVRESLLGVVGPTPFLVRSILFDKTAAANWHVTWHQDLSVAVNCRCEAAGWSAWSVKQGVAHAQPPQSILEDMVTVRLHLDPCTADQGALRVIPGSHRYGRLSPAQMEKVVRENEPVVCGVAAGDAVLMKPLLLHASSKAACPAHRRVLHFEFASVQLPAPLQWIDEELTLDRK